MCRLLRWIFDARAAFPDLTRFWSVGAEMQPFSEDSAVGTETSVPHGNPSRSSNVSSKPPWKKASHRCGKGQLTKPLGRPRPELCRASLSGAGRLSVRGRVVSGARSPVLRMQPRPLRSDTRAAQDRTSTRSRALPPRPRQAFGFRRPGAWPSHSPTADASLRAAPAARRLSPPQRIRHLETQNSGL